MIINEKPHFLEYLSGCQTLRLCEVAINKAIKESKGNVSHTFCYVEVQSEEMVKKVILADDRCYRHVKPEFRNYDLDLLAVSKEPNLIRDIPGYHTEEMAEVAVNANPRSVQWVSCEDPVVQERLTLKAIELNLQAMPSPKSKSLSEKVITRYKELCIEGNYFDVEWAPRLNFTQGQILNMLRARKQWIEAYKIFKLLNDDYKLIALEEELIKYRLDYMNVDDLLAIESLELLTRLLSVVSSKIVSLFFLHLLAGDERIKIKNILAVNGLFLKNIADDDQTEDFCLTAVRQNTESIKFVRTWTPAIRQLFTSKMETLNTTNKKIRLGK
ncbi:hypothetical protein D3C71_1210320 [compost metagenome]